MSISNHYVTSSTEYPIEVDRRKLRKVALHHWSWVDVLTEAVVQKEHRGVSDPDQAYVLNELIRYMSNTRSGVLTFEGMGPTGDGDPRETVVGLPEAVTEGLDAAQEEQEEGQRQTPAEHDEAPAPS